MKRPKTPTDPRKVCIAAAQRFDSMARLAHDNGEPTAYLRDLSARLREVAKMHAPTESVTPTEDGPCIHCGEYAGHALGCAYARPTMTQSVTTAADPREGLIDELTQELASALQMLQFGCNRRSNRAARLAMMKAAREKGTAHQEARREK